MVNRVFTFDFIPDLCVFDEIENACEAEPLSEFLAYELTHRGGQADNPLRIRVMCIKASVSPPTQPRFLINL